MPPNGLEEFREVLSDVKSITTWAIGGTVVAPLADLVLHVGAPWPNGVPVVTSLVELASMICVFHFWRSKNQKQLKTRLVITLLVLFVSLFGYLFLIDSYTFVNPATSRRFAKGFCVLPEIETMIPTQIANPEAALAGNEYREEEVWTAGSITGVRIVLLMTWLLVFSSLAAFIGTFVIAQRRRRPRVRAQGGVRSPLH